MRIVLDVERSACIMCDSLFVSGVGRVVVIVWVAATATAAEGGGGNVVGIDSVDAKLACVIFV